jgi:hypothetical protein
VVKHWVGDFFCFLEVVSCSASIKCRQVHNSDFTPKLSVSAFADGNVIMVSS